MNAFAVTSPPPHTSDGGDVDPAPAGEGGVASYQSHTLPVPPTTAPPPAMGRRGSTTSLRRPTTAVALTDAFSDCGATLLHSAAGQGDRAAMKTFFQTFDVDVIDNQGRTPVMYACTTNKVKSVELLVKQGCDLHTQGTTWLACLARYQVCLSRDVRRCRLNHTFELLPWRLIRPPPSQLQGWCMSTPSFSARVVQFSKPSVILLVSIYSM